MRSLGLLQYRSAGELQAEEASRAQEVQDAEARQREIVESSLAAHIRRCWEDAKMAKQEIEYRLLDCLRRRKGEYDPGKLTVIRAEGGSAIYMMLTATKCRAAAAWIRDILMPVNEKPWGLEPTPVAEVPPEYVMPIFEQFFMQAQAEAQEAGEQVDPQALMKKAEEHIRHAVQQKAEEAAERHEELIADQMAEGGWDEAFEPFVDDFVTYPTAIVRGHTLRKVPTLSWLEGWKPVKTFEVRPEWERVSPFDFYPSPDSTDIDDGAYLIERCRFTRSQLNKMLGVPSFSDESIRRVLEDHGRSGLRDWLWTDGERAQLEDRGHEWLTRGETIDGLIYCGGAQGTTLLQWGMSPDAIDDPLAEYDVEAILIGNHVIRVKINRDPLERRPYHKASFHPVPGSFWGQGIPELMSDIQDMCNATARSLANNLAIASGPQVEVFWDRLDPSEDGSEIYPWKIWKTKDSNVTGNNPAVRFFQPDSNASELLAVYDQFEKRADDATNIPRYIYGNENIGGAGNTASGLSMLMESANKGIKDAIRHIDRGVIRRVIAALWLHNMQYSNDQSIKGDCNVVPRGSSAMLIREQTHQFRTQFLQMTTNPTDMQIIGNNGRRALLENIAEKLDMPGLIPTEEEMQQNLSQQQQLEQIQFQLEQALQNAKLEESQAKTDESRAKAAKTQAEAEEVQADTAQAQAETMRTQTMTPLEARKLLLELQQIIFNMRNGDPNARARLEGAGQNRQLPGGRAANGTPGAGPQGGREQARISTGPFGINAPSGRGQGAQASYR